jgi:hypothetical protein
MKGLALSPLHNKAEFLKLSDFAKPHIAAEM